MTGPFAFDALLREIGGSCDLEGDVLIDGIASLNSAGPSQLSFLSAKKYRSAASSTRAAAVLVRSEDASVLPKGTKAWVVSDPYLAYAKLTFLWRYVDHSASCAEPVAKDAQIGEGVRIGPGVTVGPGAIIGDRARIAAGVHIGAGAIIGARTELRGGVVIEHACSLGQDVLVHANTVIGSDGFGFARDAHRQWIKIYQLGKVHVGDEVEIGAQCSIDRGALDDTRIGHGSKLDNQIQIGHNVVIGDHCALAGCVCIAGSTTLGKRVMAGGGAGILGHLYIADDVVIAAMSLIAQSILEPGVYGGSYPQMPQRQAERSAANLKQLPNLRSRLMRLEAEIKQILGSDSSE